PMFAIEDRQVWFPTVTTTLGRRPPPSSSTTSSGISKPAVLPPCPSSTSRSLIPASPPTSLERPCLWSLLSDQGRRHGSSKHARRWSGGGPEEPGGGHQAPPGAELPSAVGRQHRHRRRCAADDRRGTGADLRRDGLLGVRRA